MSSSGTDFDPVGVVIDWLDACRQRRLADLLELYADNATLDCCDGGRFVRRSGLFRYWQGKLQTATQAAFELQEVVPEGDCVILDYVDYDGTAARTKFWFNDEGNISRTRCTPFGGAGSRSNAA
ncbi:ketosteroid isomerase-like protein [Bradyrhizobium elkanii]|uniref:nuclear transport factor 2 family protein n=1 Tax=Bradyrhizobium TaxID=374 RepID=UPI00201BFA93|nr:MULTISPECIES: nuclear transport factor 2 family protein [Bradyrhizobium]MCS3932054.1 ketosteroid isomerase-like protein [Bradyrhizobium elkanii]MCS3972612.1 ketosteroid isomerase-like protein [Bradyrhizobium japonicum]